MNLFPEKKIHTTKTKSNLPLALRIRPTNLEEFIGQKHILGKEKLLKRSIEADRLSSIILYGPPGTGKTTLAYIISNMTNANFKQINAVTSNVQELRKIILEAKNRKKLDNKKTILFIDEIHRFNKAQQDVLIPEIEKATPILIGATIHNPFFSIISPLISRSTIFELKPLDYEEIKKIIKRALTHKKGLANYKIKITPKAIDFIIKNSDGDARKALNALEIGVLSTPKNKKGEINFTVKIAKECMQKKLLRYDKNQDSHYNTISAYIKSIRGSDPDAAIYWLAKMLYAGEDPLFIARRLVICASEDIGNADPQAINIANSALQITQFIGMPECQLTLSQATIYLACCPKSNASCKAIKKALDDVKYNKSLEVPEHLKDSHYPGAKQLGHGEKYKYPHNFKNHYVKQEYIPSIRKYYNPTDSGYEKILSKKLKERIDKNEL